METSSAKPSRLELWGGIESTRNRVGDRCIDQLALTGHDRRASDLDLFAGLGISALRYPVLWERTAPNGLESADWTWPDERLARLRELGIRPIVGLLHHGNGPDETSLLDPHFPCGLAEYARAVAARYPWVDAYTPINEPLTTARFSGLYGVWYPHARDHKTFVEILLRQCQAIVLAMQAMREVNPGAQLIQTEDLGTIYSSPALAHQAEYENQRRWLTFDLLCGRVDSRHPLWSWLLSTGIPQSSLQWHLDHQCPPDIVGIDHYLSSDRFLDEQLDRYPPETYGGNGHQAYADVLAVRVRAEETSGIDSLLSTTWERYGLPVALTEAHNGCTREEQMRWFVESWEAARRAREYGIDVRAVTAWSLLGIDGWDALAVGKGRYEPGVFDVRSPEPRPTAMVRLLQELSRRGMPGHPLLSIPGWWRRPVRFEYGVSLSRTGEATRLDPAQASMDRWPARHPLLITGGTGTLGQGFASLCDLRGIPYRLLSRAELEIADPESVVHSLDAINPWAVVNAAGYSDIDEAEGNVQRCRRENVTGPENLARACARRGIRLLTISSDQVFDGRKRSPYVESDPTDPLNVYGESKVDAERRVLAALPTALIVRPGPIFGPWDETNFVARALRALSAGWPFMAASDGVVSPSYLPDLVNAALDLLIDEEQGIWHLANDGETTWKELATQVADLACLPSSMVQPCKMSDFALLAQRPPYRALGSERGQILPTLGDALIRYMAECGAPQNLQHSSSSTAAQ